MLKRILLILALLFIFCVKAFAEFGNAPFGNFPHGSTPTGTGPFGQGTTSTPAAGDSVLLEDNSSYMLMETEDKILLE